MRSWKDIKFYHGYSYNDIKNTQKQWKEMEKKYNPVKRIRRTCIKILFIILIIAICGFLLIHAESELDSLHETYSSLDGTENTNSKYSFKKSLEFVYKLAGKEVPISLHTDLGGKPVVDWEDIAPGEDDSTLDGGEGEEDSGTGEILKPQTDEVKKAIVDALKGKGYDDVAIAAVLGNIFAESAWVPGATQNHTHDWATNDECISRGCTTNNKGGKAHGLVQWDAGRCATLINGAKSSGREWTNLEYQIEFMLLEMDNPANKVKPNQMNGLSIEEAVFQFASKYERCGVGNGCPPKYKCASQLSFDQRHWVGHWDKRLEASQKELQ